jgi:molecular chaperone GrpE (heat shock protein)
LRCDADAVHASKSTLNKMPRRRLLVGGVATAFLTIASALQPALRVRTPALARVTRPPVASAYTVLRAAENDDDTVAVEDEEAASDEADEAVEAEETVDDDEEEEEEEAEDPNAEVKAEIAQLEAQLKEKRLELSRANGAAAEASEAGYYRIVADVSTYKKNAAKQQESVAEVAKADAFRIFDKVLLAFEEARAEPPNDDDEAKVHSDFELISSGLLEQFKLLGLEEFEAAAGDAYEPWRHEAVESRPSEKDVAEVAECLMGGYRLKSTGAVVRKAKCVVDLAKEKEASDEEESEEESEADEEAEDA